MAKKFASYYSYPVSVSGVITLPVSASVYQSMVANMQQQDGVCVGPLVQVRRPIRARRQNITAPNPDLNMIKLELDDVEQGGEGLEGSVLSVGGGVAQVMLQGSGEAQVLQVLSLKDATVLTKAMVAASEGGAGQRGRRLLAADAGGRVARRRRR
ncbi:DNA-binding protein Ewg [Eumeta japonica]|uniref:DNA-binding protein Ewg n=1 Tax=Eumeta variegata TaxID=151549 RepID=A0A4C1WKJ7_EUMVA|nr:DNA-binding protein Ewg [Eumeta japonica]